MTADRASHPLQGMLNRIDLVIFDCDGVLVDSEVIACRVDAEVLTEAGYPISGKELMTRFVGMPAPAIVAELEKEHGTRPMANLDQLRRARVMEAFSKELGPIKGIKEALQKIRLPRCVASSSHPERIEHALRLTGLREFFGEHIFSATMVKRGKPAPDLFLYAAGKMGAKPENSIVIEDSTSGVKAGKAAGMRVIGFAGGSHCLPGHEKKLRDAGADDVIREMGMLANVLVMD